MRYCDWDRLQGEPKIHIKLKAISGLSRQVPSQLRSVLGSIKATGPMADGILKAHLSHRRNKEALPYKSF